MNKTSKINSTLVAWLIIGLTISFVAGVWTGFMIDDHIHAQQMAMAQDIQPSEDTTPQENSIIATDEVKQPIADFDDLKFRHKLIYSRNVSEIRKDDYGTNDKLTITLVSLNYGTATNYIDIDELDKTIKAVLLRMPNIRTTKTLRALLLETAIVETFLMPRNMRVAEKRYRNYGLCQFKLSSAKETLEWLKDQRKDVYTAVMALYDTKQSLKDNLNFNIPFSIALACQYYWRVCPDLYSNIKTATDRAKLWKSYYNTPLGVGTVNVYLRRVKAMKKKFPDHAWVS